MPSASEMSLEWCWHPRAGGLGGLTGQRKGSLPARRRRLHTEPKPEAERREPFGKMGNGKPGPALSIARCLMQYGGGFPVPTGQQRCFSAARCLLLACCTHFWRTRARLMSGRQMKLKEGVHPSTHERRSASGSSHPVVEGRTLHHRWRGLTTLVLTADVKSNSIHRLRP